MNRILSLVMALAISGLFMACDNATDSVQVASVDVPELLQRGSKIQNGKEWDQVQNLYAAALSELRTKEVSAEPYIRLAEVYMHEARVTGEHGHYYPGALEVLDHALTIPTITADQKFRALSHQSSVMLSQHEFSKALSIAKEAIRINQGNAQIYGALVDAYVELGDYEKAVRMADRMIQMRPDLRSYSRVSYLRQLHGDIPGAIQAMQMAVDAGAPGAEQSAWARLTLGELYEQSNDLTTAEAQYQRILAERTDYPFAIAALANVAFQNGELDKAEQMLQTAISIIPEVGFYEQLAHVYKAQNRTVELNQIIEEIFVMLQDDVDSGHNMNLEYANLYMDLLEDHDQALSFATEEYKKRPTNIDVNRLMALILNRQSKTAEALKHAQVAQRTGANFPELRQLTAALSKK